MDLALNNQERFICHNTKTTNQPYLILYFLAGEDTVIVP